MQRRGRRRGGKKKREEVREIGQWEKGEKMKERR